MNNMGRKQQWYNMDDIIKGTTDVRAVSNLTNVLFIP